MRAAVDKDPGHSRGIVEAAKQHRRQVRGDQRHAEALLGNAGPEGEARGDDDRGLARGGIGSERPFDHPVDRLEEGANKELEDHRSAAEWVPDPLVLDRRDEVELGERVNKLEARLLGHLAKPPGSDQRDAHPATAQFPADPDEGMDIAGASQGDEDGVRFLPGERHGRGQKGVGPIEASGLNEAMGFAKPRPLPSCPVAGNPSPGTWPSRMTGFIEREEESIGAGSSRVRSGGERATRFPRPIVREKINASLRDACVWPAVCACPRRLESWQETKPSGPLASAASGGRFRHGGPVMKTVPWNTAIQALVLVRIGQELGTQSQFARAVHDLVSAVLAFGM